MSEKEERKVNIGLDEETHANLIILARHYDFNLKRTVKQLVADKMSELGIKPKKISGVAAR